MRSQHNNTTDKMEIEMIACQKTPQGRGTLAGHPSPHVGGRRHSGAAGGLPSFGR